MKKLKKFLKVLFVFNILKVKATMKYGQVMKLNNRNIFL